MTDRLQERLEALTENPPRGDWLDVQRRVRRRRSRRAVVIVVAAALTAFALVPLGLAGRIVDLLTVEQTEEQLPRPAAATPPYVYGETVYRYGRETRLAQTLVAPFLGPYEPLAITSPDGESIVYHAWEGPLRGRGPALLRRHDFRTGADEVLVRGAQSFAWRRDGAVAYMRSARPEYVPDPRGIPPVTVGHVEVRPSPDGPVERWSTDLTGYVVRAWAKQTLLVEVRPSLVLPDTQPQAGVYAFDGPARARRLPITDVIAVSPDGSRVVGRWRRSDAPSPTVRLVDVASGRTLAQASLGSSGSGLGDWRGNTVVAVSSFAMKSSLHVLEVTQTSLTPTRRFSLDERAGLAGRFGAHFHLPRFVADDEVVVGVTTANEDETSAVRFLTCDLAEQRCRSGRSLRPLTRWASLLANPSRP